jgi:hypothetical protein
MLVNLQTSQEHWDQQKSLFKLTKFSQIFKIQVFEGVTCVAGWEVPGVTEF